MWKWLRDLVSGSKSDGERNPAPRPSGIPDPSERAPRPAPPPSQRRKIYCVGVDFGTSGTKVALRDLTDARRPPILIDFGTRMPKLARFAIPSVVAVAGGRFHIGEGALEGRAAHSTDRWSPKRLLIHGDDHAEGALNPLIPGDFREPWKVAPSAAEMLSALFLSEVLRRVHDIVEGLAAGAERTILYNMDVPLVDLDKAKTARRYQRALDTALILSRTSMQRLSVEDASRCWQEAMLQLRAHPPDAGDRAAFLVPEALAVMHGMGSALRLEDGGRYVVFDVGAATTDMGVFCYNRWPQKTVVGFFAADSFPRGCDEITERVGKEPDTSAEAQAASARAVTKEIFAHYSTTVFRDAYAKERSTVVWKTLRTLVVGGGSLEPEVRKGLCRTPRPKYFKVATVSLSDPAPCEVIGASDQLPTADELIFLFPAIGLSYLEPEMDDIVPPSRMEAIKPLRGQPTGRYHFDADDLYSK